MGNMRGYKTFALKNLAQNTLVTVDPIVTGNLRGHRDCHIEPDWILIYQIDRDMQEITFVRTGSHADLFG